MTRLSGSARRPSLQQGEEPPSACELKGTTLPLTLLKLLSPDPALLAADLAAKLEGSGEYFANGPIVIDASALSEALAVPELEALLALLLRHRLVPVGITSSRQADRDAGLAAGLAVFSAARPRSNRPASEPAAQPAESSRTAEPREAARPAEAERPAPRGTRVVSQPVRSGQRVYGRDADLTVIGAVNAGAEVLADGSVHIYGALRGRALAGARGDTGARIFCQALEAELVSIAGTYRVVEDVPGEVRGRPAQVYLDGGNLVIAPL